MRILGFSVSLYRNNGMIGNWFKKFTTLLGTNEMFEKIYKRETDSNFEWTPEHEDGMFTEQSIYAEFRTACRSIMRRAVEMSGLKVGRFEVRDGMFERQWCSS